MGEPIEDEPLAIQLHGLEDVGMVPEDDRGAGVDARVADFPLVVQKFAPTRDTPVERHDNVIYLCLQCGD